MDSFSSDIKAQPEAARRLLEEYREGSRLGERLTACAELLREGGSARPTLTFTGMGSSYFVGLAAWYAASSAPGAATARIMEAGELLHYTSASLGPDEVLVAVSQSGESIETKKLLEALRAGSPPRIIGITNQEDTGGFSANCDVVLPILAGTELAVSTKTHVNSLLVAMKLVAALGWRAAVPDNAIDRCADALELAVADCFDRAEEAVGLLGPAASLTVVARGPVSASAGYGALIMTEGTGLFVNSMTGGAFRHGPIEMASRHGLKAIVAVPRGRAQGIQAGLVRDLAALGSRLVVVTDAEDNLVAGAPGVYVWRLPWLGEYLAPLVFAVPFQALTRSLALEAGRTPGKLSVASKVTTRE